MAKRQTLIDVRPWGSFRQYTHNEQTTVKILIVNPGEILSSQRHQHRTELWIALDEGGYVVLDGEKKPIHPLDENIIIPGTWHRAGCELGAPGPIRIMEISFGVFDENDIERGEDKYNRK